MNEFKTAIQLDPNLAEAHSNYAVTLYETGDFGAAWGEAQQAQKLGKAPPAEFVEALRRKMSGNRAK